MPFIHLHNHSHYSLLDGLPKIDHFIQRAQELKMDSLALTDHGVMYGAIEFYQKAKEANIKPIIGIEAYVSPSDRHSRKLNPNEKNNHLILLAENEEGYKNLIKLTTASHLEGFYYKPRIDHELLEKYHKGIIALSACLAGEIPYSILKKDAKTTDSLIEKYKSIFGRDNFFLELQHHPNIPEQTLVNQKLIELANKHSLPLVATQDVHYIMPEDAKAQDILVAIQTGKTINDANRLSMVKEDFSMKSAEEMQVFFKKIPEAISNTELIAKRTNLNITLGETILPHFKVPAGETANSHLEKLARQNLKKRYPNGVNKEIEKRLQYELAVIGKTGFASYFLIVQDFVNWAKQKNIVVGPGRGSAAGSLVSYLINITDIDPIKYRLMFERFLNPERISMPDIDLDFADLRRDEVIEYVAQKYGKDHVAQIITFGTMAARAAVRDSGRALGFAYSFCDSVAKMIPFGNSLADALNLSPELKEAYQKDEDVKKLIDSAKKLEGVARHASTHACGIVITKDPLENYLPLQQSTQGNKQIIVTQYEMGAIEKLGLLKMDFLGLKNLTTIEKTIEFIKTKANQTVLIENIPLDDKKTFNLLQKAQVTGVFQLEQGMRRYLKRLRPSNIEDIIVLISLYRPGPLDAGMVEEYIERKNGRKKVVYTHPELESILKDTYGIIVYQEQLLQIAQKLAKFSLSEADTLRKAVGKKIKKLLDEQKDKLIKGMVDNKINKSIAEEIWRFIEPFARYGFNRSHAACYALIAYQTAYLKAHFPIEFMTALMISEENDIERIAFLIDECKNIGIEVLPPNINESNEHFASKTLDKIQKIHFGLAAIKNVGKNITTEIVRERNQNGPFVSLDNFIQRMALADLNKKSWESLIKAGGFDTLGERNQLLQNLENILLFSREQKKNKASGQISLFGNTETSSLTLKETTPASSEEKLKWEKELLGLYLSDHPLKQYQDILEKNFNSIKSLESASIQQAAIAGLVNRVQKLTTRQGKPMAFLEIEDTTGNIEIILFPSLLEGKMDLSPIMRENNIITAYGRVDRRDNKPKLIAEKLQNFDPLSTNQKGEEIPPGLPFSKGGEDIPNKARQSLKIILPKDADKNILLKIREKLVSSEKGNYFVSLFFKDSKTDPDSKEVKTSFAIAITPFLLQELENLVGKNSLVIE